MNNINKKMFKMVVGDYSLESFKGKEKIRDVFLKKLEFMIDDLPIREMINTHALYLFASKPESLRQLNIRPDNIMGTIKKLYLEDDILYIDVLVVGDGNIELLDELKNNKPIEFYNCMKVAYCISNDKLISNGRLLSFYYEPCRRDLNSVIEYFERSSLFR